MNHNNVEVGKPAGRDHSTKFDLDQSGRNRNFTRSGIRGDGNSRISTPSSRQRNNRLDADSGRDFQGTFVLSDSEREAKAEKTWVEHVTGAGCRVSTAGTFYLLRYRRTSPVVWFLWNRLSVLSLPKSFSSVGSFIRA